MARSLDDALRDASRRTHRPLYAKYELLKDSLFHLEYNWWAAGFPEGNDHGPQHIERVLEHLSEILGDEPLRHLSPYELFLTMMTVLYHDVALLRGRDEHAGESAKLVAAEESGDYILDDRDRDVIMAAVRSHSSNTNIDVENASFQDEVLIGNHVVRPRLIAALVRLADEIDEDHRRASRKVQIELKLPKGSQFFWEFCQRIDGIRANRKLHAIEVQVTFEHADINRTVLYKGRNRGFIVAFAEKLAKTNKERVYVNGFLPGDLKLTGVVVSVRERQANGALTVPRKFTFEDGFTSADFLAAYPSLFRQPAQKELARLRELIRTRDWVGARQSVDTLDPLVGDMPAELATSTLYAAACLFDLANDNRRALAYLRRWWRTGYRGGGFSEAGETPRNAIFKLGNEADLFNVLTESRQQVLGILPVALRDALPIAPKSAPTISTSSAGGCLVGGTLIRTIHGLTAVEALVPGVELISPDPSLARVHVTRLDRIVRSISDQIVTIHGVQMTPGQLVLDGSGNWRRAGDLTIGETIQTIDGRIVLESTALERSRVDVFDVVADAEPHTFVAQNVILHNKTGPAEPDG